MFKSVQTALQLPDADLLGVAHIPDARNGYMVWLLPEYTLRYAILNTVTDLQSLPIPGKEKYLLELTPLGGQARRCFPEYRSPAR